MSAAFDHVVPPDPTPVPNLLQPGALYRIDGAGEALVFSRIGGTGLAILHPPGEPDMQSSCAVEPERCEAVGEGER